MFYRPLPVWDGSLEVLAGDHGPNFVGPSHYSRTNKQACDPAETCCLAGSDPESGGVYWFAVERCNTLGKLVHWAGHLAEKSWISDTDWAFLLLEVGTWA